MTTQPVLERLEALARAAGDDGLHSASTTWATSCSPIWSTTGRRVPGRLTATGARSARCRRTGRPIASSRPRHPALAGRSRLAGARPRGRRRRGVVGAGRRGRGQPAVGVPGCPGRCPDRCCRPASWSRRARAWSIRCCCPGWSCGRERRCAARSSTTASWRVRTPRSAVTTARSPWSGGPPNCLRACGARRGTVARGRVGVSARADVPAERDR